MFQRYGIAGLGAGAGKDTLAAEMMRQTPGMVRIGFADKIKEIVADVLGIDVATVESIKNDETNPKCSEMRTLLQVVGTEAFRAYDKDVWVKAALAKVERARKAGATGVCITDLRFPNEFDMLECAGFYMVDVQCPTRFLRIQPGHPRYMHESERALDSYRTNKRFYFTAQNDRETPVQDLARLVLERGCLHAMARNQLEAAMERLAKL